MSKDLTNLLIGLGIPLGLSALWFGLVRRFVSQSTAATLYTSAPAKYIAPAVLVAVALAVAALTWAARRYTAYGALAACALAAVVALVLLRDSAAT